MREVEKYSTFSERTKTILKLFEHCGWIEIVDLDNGSFIYLLGEDHIFEKEILKIVFNNLDIEIKKKNNLFYIQ